MFRVLLIPVFIILAVGGLNPTPVNAYFASRVTVSGNTFSTGTWNESTTTTEEASSPVVAPPDLVEVKTALLNSDEPGELYSLMSSSFQSLFSDNDFAKVWAGGSSIVSVEYLTLPTQTLGSDWYERPAKITFSDGTFASYNLIFHLESGSWKLYATEDIL